MKLFGLYRSDGCIALRMYCHGTVHFKMVNFLLYEFWASLVAQLVKESPAMQHTPVGFLGREDPLEKG